MTKLHGEEALINDMVHDVAHGEGKIIEVDGPKIIVRFGRRQYPYNESGVGPFGRCTLYWADPILIGPPKNRTVWLFVSRMIKETFAKLSEMSPQVFRVIEDVE